MTVPAFDMTRVEESVSKSQSLMIVCGETSSDEHTAPIVSYLRSKMPSVEIFGMGGEHLQAAGMELTVDARKSASVMGLTEVIGKLSSIIAAFKKLVLEAEKRQASAVLLVDFPDFNLRLAKQLKKKGIKVFYFISPQLWAWRQGRIKTIQKYVDAVFPIFPFEEDFYKKRGVDAKFVGHPFMQRPNEPIDRTAFFNQFQIPLNKKIVAFLPGSRTAEVTKLFPMFLEMIEKDKTDRHHYVVPVANSVKDLFNEYTIPSNMTLVPGHAREILATSDAGVVASGTATVEAALSGLPFCIVYRVSPLTYMIGKLLIKGVSHVGMPNLIYGEELLKEFLQAECTAETVGVELAKLLYDEERRKKVKEGLKVVHDRLLSKSEKTFSQIVGDEILSVFQKA